MIHLLDKRAFPEHSNIFMAVKVDGVGEFFGIGGVSDPNTPTSTNTVHIVEGSVSVKEGKDLENYVQDLIQNEKISINNQNYYTFVNKTPTSVILVLSE